MLRKYFVYNRRFVYKKGIRDGRNWKWQLGWPLKKKVEPYPSDNQTRPAEFEEELYHAANSVLAEKSEKWSRKDQSLRQACSEAENTYVETEKKMKSLSEELQLKIKKYNIAQMTYNSFAAPLPAIYFWLVALLLFASELALNLVVFNIFLAEHWWETALMALGAVLCITTVAKLQGSKMKLENKIITDYFLILGGFIFTIVVLVGLSWLRGQFFEAWGGEQVLGIEVSLIVLMIVFLSLNILFYYACLWLAYEITPKKADEFKAAKRQLKESKKELLAVSKRVLLTTGRRVPLFPNKSLLLAANINVASIQKNMKALNRFDQAHVNRTRTFEEFNKSAQNAAEIWATAVRTYRDGNVQARRIGGYGPPKYFSSVNPAEQIVIPPSLCTIDCSDCTHPSRNVSSAISPPNNDNITKEEKQVTLNSSAAGVPVMLTEITDSKDAKALFQTYIEKAGLDTVMEKVETNAGISRNQLYFCLEGQRNPREEKMSPDKFQDKKPWWGFMLQWRRQQKIARLQRIWKKALWKLASPWHVVDRRLLASPLANRHYHLYPHLVLPLAFAAGAAIGLRRPLTIYHGQSDRYFQVINLPNPRELFIAEPVNTPEVLETISGPKGKSGNDKLILHILISDRHKVNFEAHVNWRTSDNKALIYNKALPEVGWLGYLQNLIYETKKLLPLYKDVDICLVCPAAVAFALGMAFDWDTNVTVCHYDGQSYFPVLAIQDLKKLRIFT